LAAFPTVLKEQHSSSANRDSGSEREKVWSIAAKQRRIDDNDEQRTANNERQTANDERRTTTNGERRTANVSE